MASINAPVVIIGGGLAGLSCARTLLAARKRFLLLEASDGFGGRVRTDRVDGFLLDRGFQVLLTGYPDAKRLLDYDALRLKYFNSGALIRWGDRFHRVGDPWSNPLDLIQALIVDIGTFADKLRLAKLRYELTRGELIAAFERPEMTTSEFLSAYGFSPKIIDRFFKPFFGGVFLESDLKTSSRFFAYIFRLFAQSKAAIPEAGMGEISAQLVKEIPPEMVRLHAPVRSITDDTVFLTSGETIKAQAVVVATALPDARKLCGRSVSIEPERSENSVACLYFSAPKPPMQTRLLLLNAESPTTQTLINNVAIMSNISAAYAPPGRALISVSIINPRFRTMADSALQETVRSELTRWFGSQVLQWSHLKTYIIPHALPDQSPGVLTQPERPTKIKERLFICGDHRGTASINGALRSGERCAQELLSLLTLYT